MSETPGWRERFAAEIEAGKQQAAQADANPEQTVRDYENQLKAYRHSKALARIRLNNPSATELAAPREKDE